MGKWWVCSYSGTDVTGIASAFCALITAIGGYVVNGIIVALITVLLALLCKEVVDLQIGSGILAGFTFLSAKTTISQVIPTWITVLIVLIFFAFIISVVSMIIWGGDENCNGFLNITASSYGWMFFAFFALNAFFLSAVLGYAEWRNKAISLINQQEIAMAFKEIDKDEEKKKREELLDQTENASSVVVIEENKDTHNHENEIYKGFWPKWAVYLFGIIIAAFLVVLFLVLFRLWIIVANAGLKQGLSGLGWRDFIPGMIFVANSQTPSKYINFCYDFFNTYLNKDSQGQPLTLGYILCLGDMSNNFLDIAFNNPILINKFFDELCNFLEPYFLVEDIYLIENGVMLSNEAGFNKFKTYKTTIVRASDIGNIQIDGIKYYMLQHLPAAFCSSLTINYLAIRSLMLQDLQFTIDQNNIIVLRNLGYLGDSVIVDRSALSGNFVQISNLSRIGIDSRNTKLYNVVNQLLGAHILQIMNKVPIRSEYISLLQSYNISPNDSYLIGLQYTNNFIGDIWMLQKSSVVLNPVRYVYDPTIPSALSYYDNIVQEVEVSFDPNSPLNRSMDVQSQIFNLLLGGSFTTLNANNRQTALNSLYVRNVLSNQFQNLFNATTQFASLMNQIGSVISSNPAWTSIGNSGQPTLNQAYNDYAKTNFNPLSVQTSNYGTGSANGPTTTQINALAQALISNYTTLAQNVGNQSYALTYGNTQVSLNLTVDLLNLINQSSAGTITAQLSSYASNILTANTYSTSLNTIGQNILQEAIYKPVLCLSSFQNPGVTLISPSGSNSWLPSGNNPVTGAPYSQNFLYRDFMLIYGASGGDTNAILKLVVKMLQNLGDSGKYKILKDTVRQTLSYGKTLQYIMQNPYVYSGLNKTSFANNYQGYYLFDQLNNCYVNLSRMMSNYSNVQFAFHVINYTGAFDANSLARQYVLDQADMYFIKLIIDSVWYYVWQQTCGNISYSSVTDVNSFWTTVCNYQTTQFIPALTNIIQNIITNGQISTFNSQTGLLDGAAFPIGCNFNFISPINLSSKITAIASNYFHDFMVGSMLAQGIVQCGFNSATQSAVLSNTCFATSALGQAIWATPFQFIDPTKTKVMVIPNDDFQVQFLGPNQTISPAPTVGSPIPTIYTNSALQLINF